MSVTGKQISIPWEEDLDPSRDSLLLNSSTSEKGLAFPGSVQSKQLNWNLSRRLPEKN